MTDGLHFETPLNDFAEWRHRTGISFDVPTNIDTGEIVGRNYNSHSTYTHRATLGTYDLRVLQTHKGGKVFYRLKVSGSLHKNYFRGTNHQRFSFQDLQKEIEYLSKALQIAPSKMILTNLEVGVNVELPFAVTPFIHNALLMHKTTAFCPYEVHSGISLGLTAKHDYYELKCYDKGLQYNLAKHLMRFELKFVKMKPLNEVGIRTVADLQQKSKVFPLLSLLVRAWNEIILNEPQIDIDTIPLSSKERELLLLARNRNEWVTLILKNRRQYNYRRGTFKTLVKRYGNNTHSEILKLLIQEWENLKENCTNSPLSISEEGNHLNKELYKFTVNENAVTLKVCKTCGRDISNQKDKSVFCSEFWVGEKQAHQCRNADSNKRNNFKRKYLKLEAKGLLFDIMPYFRRVGQNFI